MRKSYLTLTLTLLISVFSLSAQTQSETIKTFLSGIVSFENVSVDEGSPISTVNELAAEQADKIMVLTKDNVIDMVAEAEKYKHCLITVRNHTVAKITDHLDFVQSGSWGSVMPKGEGYVAKGGLNHKVDYLNNIIGSADAQERKVYFFGKK